MRQVHQNWSKGELDPELHARIDMPQYAASAKEITNFIIKKSGALETRPGSTFIFELENADEAGKLFPFTYGLDFSYVLAAQTGAARIMSGGGVVLEAEAGLLGITNAEHAQVEMPFHGLLAGDLTFIQGVEGMTEINQRFVKVLSVEDDDNFTLDLDTRGFGVFTGASGDVRDTAPPPPPPPPEPPAPPAPTEEPPAVGGGSDIPWWQGPDNPGQEQ